MFESSIVNTTDIGDLLAAGLDKVIHDFGEPSIGLKDETRSFDFYKYQRTCAVSPFLSLTLSRMAE
jgi:hypothetical protein